MSDTFAAIPRAFAETVCSMTCVEPEVVEEECAADEMTVVISLGGEPGVKVWLSADPQSISNLYEGAMGMPCDEHQEMVDFLGELANQTLGPAAVEIEGVDIHTLSLPELTEEWNPIHCWRVSGEGFSFYLGAAPMTVVASV